MSRYATTRTKTRKTLRLSAAVLVVVTAVIVGTLAYQTGSSSAPSFSEVLRGGHGGAVTEDDGDAYRPGRPPRQSGDHGDMTTEVDSDVTEEDGLLPNGVTVFDDEFPAISNLDPDLLQTLHAAATDAADDGIEFYVNSGWRSPDYQNQLLREAVAGYGSEEEAARWVATADTSPHVSGDAVDIGPSDATAWLSEHGAAYGLCQIYGNESWHYELRPQAIDNGCPPMYSDPTQDPRMQH